MGGDGKKWHVVCITGVGCSGKTTLATKLSHTVPRVHIIHQDDYFWPIESDKHVKVEGMDVSNWETVSSVDFDRLLDDANRILKSDVTEKSVLVIEGHLVLNEARICEIADVKYCLTMTKDECWKRRRHKYYGTHDSLEYFSKCAWPEYQTRLKEIATANKNLEYVKYDEDFGVICKEIINKLTKLID